MYSINQCIKLCMVFIIVQKIFLIYITWWPWYEWNVVNVLIVIVNTLRNNISFIPYIDWSFHLSYISGCSNCWYLLYSYDIDYMREHPEMHQSKCSSIYKYSSWHFDWWDEMICSNFLVILVLSLLTIVRIGMEVWTWNRTYITWHIVINRIMYCYY